MALNFNGMMDNVPNHNKVQHQQQSTNLTLNDVQSLMATPTIIGVIVSKYEDALQYNIGFSNNIFVFINPYQRQVYMKYVETSTGRDVLHVFQSAEPSPVEQFAQAYNSTNTNNDMTNKSNTQDALTSYVEQLNLVNSKLDRVLTLEPNIQKIINELGVEDASSTK